MKGVRQMKTWRITINFGGYIGVEEEYEVDAETREEAEEEAFEMARDDLSIVSVEEEEWGE